MPSSLLRIHVQSPASVANLGSGYDCLALAVDLWNHYDLYAYQCSLGDRQEFSFTTSFTGAYGAGDSRDSRIETEDGNSFVQSFIYTRRYLCAKAGRIVPRCPCFVDQRVDIPPVRGLGSSSSACIAGTLAAFAFVARVYPDLDLAAVFAKSLRSGVQGDERWHEIFASLAMHIDRCPDNLCASLAGGLTYAFAEPSGPLLEEAPQPLHFFRDEITDDSLCCVALIPENMMETHLARAVLRRANYSLEQVVFNLTRSTCLPRVIKDRRYDLLRAATMDHIHEERRAREFYRTIPGDNEIDIRAVCAVAVDAGAYTAFVSGAGSTLVALCDQSRAGDVEVAFRDAFETAAIGWEVPDDGVKTLRITNRGATWTASQPRGALGAVERWVTRLGDTPAPMELGECPVTGRVRPAGAGVLPLPPAPEGSGQAGDIGQTIQSVVIHGGQANFGAGSAAQQVANITGGPAWDGLRQSMLDLGVRGSDIEDLRQALESDADGAHDGQVGPATHGWLRRVAESGREIGTSVSSEVLKSLVLKLLGAG